MKNGYRREDCMSDAVAGVLLGLILRWSLIRHEFANTASTLVVSSAFLDLALNLDFSFFSASFTAYEKAEAENDDE